MISSPDPDPILEALGELLPQLERGGVTELDVSVGETRLYLRRRPGAAARGTAAPEATAPDEDDGLVGIVTPLSGVFYGAPAPDEPPYVEEGSEVEAGQTVALVEAMKVFNEIHVDVPGTVARILVTSGQLVSSGQALMKIRPSGEPAVTPSEPV